MQCVIVVCGVFSVTAMSFAVLEPVVRVVVVFCQSAGADNRIQICRLGETVFVPLLRVWKSKPADRLKVTHDHHCHFLWVFLTC